jgi:hypothetical protein
MPGRHFNEPLFAAASVVFAEQVADELIEAADRAAAAWEGVAGKFAGGEKELATMPMPPEWLVWQVGNAWMRKMSWQALRLYRDGIRFRFPSEIVAPLRECSSIGDFDFMFAANPEYFFGQLRSDDTHCDYQLVFNFPYFVQLAVIPQFRGAFVRNIRMVMHHEMGHFRFSGGSLRAELVAHARGVAALVDDLMPGNSEDLKSVILSECPEIWNNDEIRELVTNTKGGPRLVRAWSSRRNRVCQIDNHQG